MLQGQDSELRRNNELLLRVFPKDMMRVMGKVTI